MQRLYFLKSYKSMKWPTEEKKKRQDKKKIEQGGGERNPIGQWTTTTMAKILKLEKTKCW